MKKFVFNLAAVLRERKMKEERAQKIYAEALLKVRETEEKISAKHREAKMILAKPLKLGTIEVRELIDNRRLIEHIYLEANGLEEILRQNRSVAEAKRQELLEASKRRQAIEKLKEKRQASWKFESLREEQMQLDEIGSQRFER